MPKLGRVLPFPKAEVVRSHDERSTFVRDLFEVPFLQRSQDDLNGLLDADTLVLAIALLRERSNSSPMTISDEASRLYDLITKADTRIGVFDECDYFLGDIAFIAATSYRHLGHFDVASRWLDVADSHFRATVNPAPSSALVAYARLAILYDRREPVRVLEGVPLLIRGFEQLGMPNEQRKARFLQAMTLKLVGEDHKAFQCFESLREDLPLEDFVLRSRVLTEIGAELGRIGRFDDAVGVYEEAADLVANGTDPLAAAHLKGTIAETYKRKGELNVAVDCFRLALADFAKLGMLSTVAYYRVVLAETLYLAKRDKEAEWEVRAAIPVIEELQMASEGIAAVGMLKASLQRRGTDHVALEELRGHLEKLA